MDIRELDNEGQLSFGGVRGARVTHGEEDAVSVAAGTKYE